MIPAEGSAFRIEATSNLLGVWFEVLWAEMTPPDRRQALKMTAPFIQIRDWCDGAGFSRYIGGTAFIFSAAPESEPPQPRVSATNNVVDSGRKILNRVHS